MFCDLAIPDVKLHLLLCQTEERCSLTINHNHNSSIIITNSVNVLVQKDKKLLG